MKPVIIAETENNRKKLEPISPNSRGLSRSSCIIGTAAIPITALSAKLTSINRNSRATISQASLGVPVRYVSAALPSRTEASQIWAFED